jgi:hypothetical protein
MGKRLVACREDSVTMLSFSRFPFLGPWEAFKRVSRDFGHGG